MSDAIQEAKQLIEEGNYKDAVKIARKRHGKDDIDSYLSILDILIEKEYLPALEEKGMYYQYYDPNHDNNDYGEKYNTYSKIEKPRISKKEVKMSKIELLIQANEYKNALTELDKYETQYGTDKKLDLYKGQMLQKNGKNEEALEYLEKSLSDEHTMIGLNAKADALYKLGRYDEALHDFNQCIQYEREAGDDLELITNFNYKAAFCCIKLGDNQEAVKHLNKTINMLNEHGRLPKDLESIYQKCSFKKDELMKQGDVEDQEFKKTKFISSKYAIYALIIIMILYIILKIFGY